MRSLLRGHDTWKINYYRELYLPPLTSGPSSVAWAPDSNLETFTDGLKRGRTFASNGPLINFALSGAIVGSDVKLDTPQSAVPFTARLRSIVPVDHFELVCNGKVVQEVKLGAARVSADIRLTIPLRESGWCVLRTWSAKAEYPVLDNCAYATTSPIHINVADAKPHWSENAKYFAAWIARTSEITAVYGIPRRRSSSHSTGWAKRNRFTRRWNEPPARFRKQVLVGHS